MEINKVYCQFLFFRYTILDNRNSTQLNFDLKNISLCISSSLPVPSRIGCWLSSWKSSPRRIQNSCVDLVFSAKKLCKNHHIKAFREFQLFSTEFLCFIATIIGHSLFLGLKQKPSRVAKYSKYQLTYSRNGYLQLLSHLSFPRFLLSL